MAQITIKDDVIWKKHIHGDPALAEAVEQLRGGETIQLRVEGRAGLWRKMEDGSDGRPTSGLRPEGPMKEVWRELYRSRKGQIVAVERDDESTEPPVTVPANLFRALARTEAERRAAIDALLSAAGQGWRSDGEKMTRDEMHER